MDATKCAGSERCRRRLHLRQDMRGFEEGSLDCRVHGGQFGPEGGRNLEFILIICNVSESLTLEAKSAMNGSNTLPL